MRGILGDGRAGGHGDVETTERHLAVAGLKSGAVYASLRSDILSGALDPGERLVLRRIATDHGTSDIPVREALRMLERDGLVEMVPYHGAQVVRLSPTQVRDAYFVRGHLESIATSLAADRLTEEDHRRLDDLMAQMHAAVEEQAAGRYAQLNREFHGVIIHACGNQVLRDVLTNLEAAQRSFMVVFRLRPSRLAESYAEHEHLLDLLRRQDAEGAAALALAHKLAVSDALEEAVADQDGTTAT